jgi:hypothetical protein
VRLPADPRWTPVVGGAVVVLMMAGCYVAWAAGARGGSLAVAMVVAVVVAAVGFLWTLRDWPTPRRR